MPFEERDYFKQPFSRDELVLLLDGASPRTVLNSKSVAFKKSGLNADELPDERILELLLEEPRYFKRPLVVADGRLLVGLNAQKLAEALD